MGEFVNLLKELLLIKQEDYKAVGLAGFKKKVKPAVPKIVPKKNKEVKISDLMRKSTIR